MRLAEADIEFLVDPLRGGRISQLTVARSQLLVTEEEAQGNPLGWGCYPMVPFAGRVRGGRFSFAGRGWRLPEVTGGHALHGYGYCSPWEQVSEDTIELNLGDPWPFRGWVQQRFSVHPGGMTVVMEVRAFDRQPVSVGWHPWFRRRIGGGDRLDVEVHPGPMYELDEDDIPTGRLVPPPPGPWDTCFVEMGAPPRLQWGDAVAITIDSSCDHWVIYDRPENALCIEPQSEAPDAVNRDPVVVIEGDRLVHSMTIAVAAPSPGRPVLTDPPRPV